jgi:phospholipase C
MRRLLGLRLLQPLDYFVDGTRIPMILVSTFTKGGHISHSNTDHVSTLKFIERNWGAPPITARSRDNLPNPLVYNNPYITVNSPAIGDLFDIFDFDGAVKNPIMSSPLMK